MKNFKILFLLLGLISIISCSDDDDQSTINNDEEIDDFVYRGMNLVYLYKSDVNDLSDDRFTNNEVYQSFLAKFDTPELLFAGLTASQDRFSFIVDDYIALEQSLSGISLSDGMDFGLTLISENSDDVLGFVRYILPGTDAEAKGIQRGEFFNTIDGVQLTRNSDFNEIFSRTSLDIGFVSINDGVITPSKTVTLTKMEYTENPILVSKTFNYKGTNFGYLMYNGFTFGFNEQLNNAFGEFKNENIDELILDLRYNGGGSVATAVGLAGMITGQFTGEVFLKQTWNDQLQNQFSSGPQGEEALIDRFQDSIAINTTTSVKLNSLNLPKLYVLTSDRTASASELIINSLDPYIEVIQIGTTTVGKFQASATFYDSENLGRNGANPDHTYAIQPLIFKSENRNGVSDFIDGLVPDVVFEESILNLGNLGETDEPFLRTALDFIVDGTIPTKRKSDSSFKILGESKMFQPTYQKMYIEHSDLPDIR